MTGFWLFSGGFVGAAVIIVGLLAFVDGYLIIGGVLLEVGVLLIIGGPLSFTIG